jgi:ABC-type sugar transport system permease subunit
MSAITAKKRRPFSIGRMLTYLLLYSILLSVSILVLYPLLFTLSSAFSLGDSLAGLTVYPFQQPMGLRQFERLFN